MNVLIVKLGAIGDIVMAMPMIEAARRLDPHARITWLCGRTVEPLLRTLGTIDELIALDEAALLKGSTREQASVVLESWRRLAGRQFDLVATGYRDRRYLLLSATARARVRRSFAGDRRASFIAGRYHGDEYVRLVLGVDGPDAPSLPLPRASFELPPELGKALSRASRPWVVLAPGGARNILRDDALRRWPVRSYVALAQLLLKGGITVILAGAPDDDWVRNAFGELPVLDVIGQTDLLHLAALCQASDVVITHDSGPMHIAALAGAPLVALFGPTQPREKIRASSQTIVLWGGEDLACRPCYDGIEYAPCADNVCIQRVTVGQVHDAVRALLARRSQPEAAQADVRSRWA